MTRVGSLGRCACAADSHLDDEALPPKPAHLLDDLADFLKLLPLPVPRIVPVAPLTAPLPSPTSPGQGLDEAQAERNPCSRYTLPKSGTTYLAKTRAHRASKVSCT